MKFDTSTLTKTKLTDRDMDDITFEQEYVYANADCLNAQENGSSDEGIDDTFDIFSDPLIKKSTKPDVKPSMNIKIVEKKQKLDKKEEIKENEDKKIIENIKHKSTCSFEMFSFSKPIMKAIRDAEFITPTAIQQSAIPLILRGSDLFACANTGSGKTAAYLLPILDRMTLRAKNQKVTRVLILLPTRELALQVFNVAQLFAKHTDISIALSTGGNSNNKAEETLLRRRPDILVCTPGRLIDHLYNCVQFNLEDVEILVFDEADRLLDNHFKEQANEIVRLSSKARQTLMFSATLCDEIRAMIKFSLNNPIKLTAGRNKTTVSTLEQRFIRIKPNMEELCEPIVCDLVCNELKDHQSIIMFCSTKKSTHRLYTVLKAMQLSVSQLHGDMSQARRFQAYNDFKDKKFRILVSTNLASRGLDIDDVDAVINMHAPKTYDDYIHRVGRTARAGKNGLSITLIGESDKHLFKIIRKNTKDATYIKLETERISEMKEKINDLQYEIKRFLEEDKQLQQIEQVEREVTKAQNLIKHKNEISSRPKRKWFEVKKPKMKHSTQEFQESNTTHKKRKSR